MWLRRWCGTSWPFHWLITADCVGKAVSMMEPWRIGTAEIEGHAWRGGNSCVNRARRPGLRHWRGRELLASSRAKHVPDGAGVSRSWVKWVDNPGGGTAASASRGGRAGRAGRSIPWVGLLGLPVFPIMFQPPRCTDWGCPGVSVVPHVELAVACITAPLHPYFTPCFR